ncbi:MBL fold metallo-hydrolase [Marinospirillum alkaliphilum]|uniref:Phosphoribosyl 1,2-cyclic phosphodiesterase n=1 Tax=Marinospirillum alkaliphilum DSM 21637 TaxID=1122209 RepID=A0A1K1W042_9GAMM|nr:MBL fold metallo-hydrolase [Marinospirillum alkaliphilum]SFX30760.1 Phosphoribosyl 1,2-cyclic phosphodiesterase [Marinospirillum alkaliphilum DSM 21637]
MKQGGRIRFASLGSGSKGNATLVSCGKTHVLIDCGFTLRETTRRLARLELTPDDLSAVLVTHEHGDHIGGVGALVRRHAVPLYTTAGTRLSGRLGGEVPDWRLINPEHPFAIGDLEVWPVTVPHDAREPVQFVLGNGAQRLGVLTDLGSITPHVVRHYRRCQALVLEANHDPQMLADGPYPPSLKRRVGGDFGHLSNQQAADFLLQIEAGQLTHLVASHLSEQNNCPHLAATELAQALNTSPDWITLAEQEQGFDWREIHP